MSSANAGHGYPHSIQCNNCNLSTISTHDRWSDLLPPPAIGGGLAFSALWDPEAGTVTLSDAKVSTTHDESTPADIPWDVQSDELSQSLTLDSQSLITQISGSNDALAAFRNTDYYIRSRGVDENDDDDDDDDERHFFGSPIASSHDHHGRDMYIRNLRFPIKARHYSCFDKLDEALSFNAETAFAEWERTILGNRRDDDNNTIGENLFERRRRRNPRRDSEGSMVFSELVLQSTFSVSTTSIQVRKGGNTGDENGSSFRSQRPKLIKRRPVNIPPPIPRPNCDDKMAKFLRGFKVWKMCPANNDLDDSWVKIDVTQVVTQSCVRV